MNARFLKAEVPENFVWGEKLKKAFENAKKDIYVCAVAGCGKSTAAGAFLKDEKNVIWINVSAFDKAESIKEELSKLLDKNAEGCTVVFDGADRCADFESFEDILKGEEARFIIISEKYSERIRGLVEAKGGKFIGNESFVFSDEEISKMCGCTDREKISQIGGYAAAARLFGKEDILLEYIYENVFLRLEKDRRRLVADTVIADRVSVGLCEYLYGSEYGARLAKGLRRSFFVLFDGDDFRVHPLLKKAVIEKIGLPEKAVNERMLEYYRETEDHKSYVKYCLWLGRKEEAAQRLDEKGFELIDSGETDFFEKAAGELETVKGDFYGLTAARGALCILKGDYGRGYELSLKALEYFKNHTEDVRFVYTAVYTARALRNTSYLKEALKVVSEADKVRDEFELIYGYFIDAEKIAVLNDLGEFNEAYDICIKSLEKAALKGNTRVKRLYERLSVCVYYFSKRLARAVYAYEKSKEFEKEDYWIKKRSEVYMYGLGALHIIGDRKKAAAEFCEKKKELIASGITGEEWYSELHYLKIAMYEAVFGDAGKAYEFSSCVNFMEVFAKSLENHNLYGEYFDAVKEIYEASRGEKIDESFYLLPERIKSFSFAPALECICVYIKILVDKGEVERVMPTVDSLIEDVGGMLNAFFVNVVMEIALYCIKKGERLKAEQYISWVGENACEIGSVGDIDKDSIKILALLSENGDACKNLEDIFIKCMLEGKEAYAELFDGLRVYKADEEVKWRTAKTKDVMAYLVYMDSEGVSKNRIIENVWQEEASKTLTPIFNTTMYNLRKGLSENAVAFGKGVYYLDKDFVSTDFAFFKEAEADFKEKATPLNALRLLSRVKIDFAEKIEGEYVSHLARRLLNDVTEALEVLKKEGLKETATAVIEKWESEFGESPFLKKCREVTEK